MSSNDEKWREYNNDLMRHASKFDWGFYRNTKLEMYELLAEEGRDKAALRTLLEICYLDINGPRNCGGVFDPELLEEFPPWNQEEAFLAPKLIEWINKLSIKLEYSMEDIHNLYTEVADKNFRNLKLPVNPEIAWEKLSKEI